MNTKSKTALRVLGVIATTIAVGAIVLAGLLAVYVALFIISCSGSSSCLSF